MSTPTGGTGARVSLDVGADEPVENPPILLTLEYDRPDAPTLVGRAFCNPAVSTAWWGYRITVGDDEVDRGGIMVEAAPPDPLDGVESVARDLLARMREKDVNR